MSDSKLPKRGEPVHAVETVGEGDHLILMSSGGQIMRTSTDDISVKSRGTIGINVFDIDKDDTLASMDVIRSVTEAEDDEE